MTVQNFLLMTGTMLPRKVVYKDALNNAIYYADAAHGSLITDTVRRVMKGTTDADWDIIDLVETDGYNNAVPDLAAVQLLSYS